MTAIYDKRSCFANPAIDMRLYSVYILFIFLTYLFFVLLTTYRVLKNIKLRAAIMAGSVYVVNEVVGTSEKLWEDGVMLTPETAFLCVNIFEGGYHG